MVLGILPAPSKQYLFLLHLVSRIIGFCLIHSLNDEYEIFNSAAIALIPFFGFLFFISSYFLIYSFFSYKVNCFLVFGID